MRAALKSILVSALVLLSAHCRTSVTTDDTCEGLTFYSHGGTCYAPSDCCDEAAANLDAQCDTTFPGHPVAVACTDGDKPPGLDCQPLIAEVGCDWGASVIECCQTSE
jgi:hypothetical protein